MRAFEVASSQPWLIRAEMLDTILDICARENVITAEVLDKVEGRREALATKNGRSLDSTRYTTRRENGVAVLNISGPIVRYADMFTEISGGTSTQHLATDFTTAIEDPSVRAIILAIDSPGGEATGIHELANVIYAARGRKPIVAYGEGMVASAAYWIGSAADEIVADATAMLGSIGVAFSMPDPTAEKQRRIKVKSTQSPMKQADPTTDAGLMEIQRWADELANVFIDAVARNRNTTAEAVLSDFGKGGLRIGQDAVAHGMADRLGSLESLIAELGRPQSAAAQTTNRRMSMSKNSTPAEANTEQPAITAEEFEALKAQLSEVNGKLAAAETAREAAEIEKKTAQANATVDGWERDGKLSGNATAKVRELYVAASIGTAVTAEQIAGMVDALPKFDTTRVSANVKPADAGATLTADDFLAADKGNHSAKNKIDAHVRTLVGEKKTYTAALKEARAAAFAAK